MDDHDAAPTPHHGNAFLGVGAGVYGQQEDDNPAALVVKLFEAVKDGRPEVVEALCSQEAAAQDGCGRTSWIGGEEWARAYELAVQYGRLGVLEVLLRHNGTKANRASMGQVLESIARWGHVQCLDAYFTEAEQRDDVPMSVIIETHPIDRFVREHGGAGDAVECTAQHDLVLWNERLFQLLCGYGRLEHAMDLYTQRVDIREYGIMRGIMQAAGMGRLRVVQHFMGIAEKLLYQDDFEHANREWFTAVVQRSMGEAAYYGRTSVLLHLMQAHPNEYKAEAAALLRNSWFAGHLHTTLAQLQHFEAELSAPYQRVKAVMDEGRDEWRDMLKALLMDTAAGSVYDTEGVCETKGQATANLPDASTTAPSYCAPQDAQATDGQAAATPDTLTAPSDDGTRVVKLMLVVGDDPVPRWQRTKTVSVDEATRMVEAWKRTFESVEATYG